MMEPSQGSAEPGRRDVHSQRPGRYGAVASAGLLAAALGYIGLVDPHGANSAYPACPFKWLTGWDCPACGGLRMVHDLLHGDLVASINDNVFLLVGIPVLGAWALLRRRRGRTSLPLAAMIVVGVAMIVWTVLRNLPGFPLVPAVYGP
ncbi:hypothetical protein MMRN_24710 [Mycobacterium marinum]|uniref:DUF2752 domain-containing protein n=2 Tax=Mycobacterium ulcerans group TaxID=2993898 RepID=A0A7I7LFB5_9MYCO|nr:hypothetical protein MMRN_24710 [Mycobacterium marinum]BBX58300.1 hypothetical protein MSHO_36450 [Mycobacterium shottsii]GJO43526.1 hypothetical protein NJB1604_19450 [Mycobacterium marinum]CDM76488.1 conserved hypothetical membrane protein [Mycobacterium marinum E11]